MKNKLQLKSKNLNIILIFLLTMAVLYFSLKDNFEEVIRHLFDLNIWWIIIGFVLIFGYWFFISMSMFNLAKKFETNIKFIEILKINVITHFFNGITPFASGGQPYQIYALKKQNIDIVDCTSICIQNFVAYQLALVLLGTIAILANNIFDIFADVKILKLFVVIGYLVNLSVAAGLFAISFTQKFNKFVLKIIITLGSKLKIVKDKDESIARFNAHVAKFNKCTKMLLKDKSNLAKVVLYNLVGLVCNYAVPMAVLYSMGDYTSMSIYLVILASAYVMLIGSFIPLPGGTGGLEYSFMAFFGKFVSGAKLSLLMLLWRFMTYYFGMIVGAITLNFGRRDEK
ncbi:MAG: flippase-like domain-containing protein [Firmicutes bacterium]|nr:flippase-like domain-containing protein [Bacillota bacterium]